MGEEEAVMVFLEIWTWWSPGDSSSWGRTSRGRSRSMKAVVLSESLFGDTKAGPWRSPRG